MKEKRKEFYISTTKGMTMHEWLTAGGFGEAIHLK